MTFNSNFRTDFEQLVYAGAPLPEVVDFYSEITARNNWWKVFHPLLKCFRFSFEKVHEEEHAEVFQLLCRAKNVKEISLNTRHFYTPLHSFVYRFPLSESLLSLNVQGLSIDETTMNKFTRVLKHNSSLKYLSLWGYDLKNAKWLANLEVNLERFTLDISYSNDIQLVMFGKQLLEKKVTLNHCCIGLPNSLTLGKRFAYSVLFRSNQLKHLELNNHYSKNSFVARLCVEFDS